MSNRRKPLPTPRGWAAVAWVPDNSPKSSLLSHGGRVIVFDTRRHAKDFIIGPLSEGRIPQWSADGETCWFVPSVHGHVNCAQVIIDYDPYHVPAGVMTGVRSETHGKAWRYHILSWHVFYNCGQFSKTRDGVVNVETGLIVPAHDNRAEDPIAPFLAEVGR